MPTAYKVVKVIGNGDRVSAVIPNWNPLYRVYIHNGEIKIIDNGMVFSSKKAAIDWASCFEYFENPSWWYELKPKEKLEVWTVEYEDKIPEDKVFLVEAVYTKDRFDCYKNSFLKKIKKGFTQMMEYARENLSPNDFDFYTSNIHTSGFVATNIKLIEKISFD